MSSTLKAFRFRVRNETTKETTEFIGDGTTMEEALKDGVKNAASTVNAGKVGNKQIQLACTTRKGRIVNRNVSDFEGDVGADYFDESTQAKSSS